MSDAPPSQRVPKASRPAYLFLALLMAWMLGVGGIMGGCETLQFYQQPTQPSLELDARVPQDMQQALETQFRARSEALNAHSGRMVPIAAANLLLSALLIVACSRALSGRLGAHQLALQAVAANAVFAVADHIASAPVRNAVIGAMSEVPPGGLAESDMAQLPAVLSWLFRLALFAQLVILGLAAVALTRPKVQQAFQARADEEA